jgi:hypothetical protein
MPKHLTTTDVGVLVPSQSDLDDLEGRVNTLEGAPGGATAWGDLTGTLADQTDLQTALDSKAASSDVTTALAAKADAADVATLEGRVTVVEGSSGFDWEGAYNGATAYVPNDVVLYNGSSYICTQNSTGNLPTNGAFWNLMAEKGATGDTGPAGNDGAPGADGSDGSDGATGPAGVGFTNVKKGNETGADSVTNTETNILEVGPIVITGTNRVFINAFVEVVKDTGTTARLATVRVRRKTSATVGSGDTLVAECRTQLPGIASAPNCVAITIVDAPGAGTFYYALMGQNGNFAITYEDKALVLIEVAA